MENDPNSPTTTAVHQGSIGTIENRVAEFYITEDFLHHFSKDLFKAFEYNKAVVISTRKIKTLLSDRWTYEYKIHSPFFPVVPFDAPIPLRELKFSYSGEGSFSCEFVLKE